MITGGEFKILFEYRMSPTVVISADKKLILHKKFYGNNTEEIVIPNFTKTTNIFLIGKTDQDTVIENGQIIDSQMVEIVGCSHQGIRFNQKEFFHYFKPMMFHNDASQLSDSIVFNFPSYLTFENTPPAIHLINETAGIVG